MIKGMPFHKLMESLKGMGRGPLAEPGDGKKWIGVTGEANRKKYCAQRNEKIDTTTISGVAGKRRSFFLGRYIGK